ncbi:DUF6496 domain-containing protein [Paraflavitalea pollutisoli]|uniref:DUF6496 domain-containing protein n=1 Tax=Paraflavitalea pollutisoli TaxID=3034143 RepID=UPI0023EE21B2|nr:DUF6496 domain-containing protein [Paraflavitalea sp. H1-2-19X]
MAKYSKGAQKSVESAMHRKKKGTLKSGKGGKGGTVKSRAQAIAIGLSEAREKGAKVPVKKKGASKKAAKKAAPTKKKVAKKKVAKKKAAPRKKAAKKKAARKNTPRKR